MIVSMVYNAFILQLPLHLSMLSQSFSYQYPYNILPSKWLLSHIIIMKTMVSKERGMNVVNMAIISPWQKLIQTKDQTSTPIFNFHVIDCDNEFVV